MARVISVKAIKPAPRHGSDYCSIGGSDGHTVRRLRWTGDKYDNARLRCNNVFTSINVAKKARDLQEQIVTAM